MPDNTITTKDVLAAVKDMKIKLENYRQENATLRVEKQNLEKQLAEIQEREEKMKQMINCHIESLGTANKCFQEITAELEIN